MLAGPARVVAQLLVIAGLAGCGGSLPQLQTGGRSSPERAQGADRRRGMDEEPERPMSLEPGDVITVRTVSAATETYEGVIVDEAGRIHLPLAGQVAVGGIPLAEAEERVQTSFRRFDRFVRVALSVTATAGRTVTVLGAVATPGRIALVPGSRLADVIALAGGPRMHVSEDGTSMPIADLDRALVYRRGRPLPLRVDLALEGHPRHNVRMRPGDHVFVPVMGPAEVTVLGSVGAPQRVRFRPGMRLTEAIAGAGGVTLEGDPGAVRIVRGRNGDRRVYGASVHDVVDGSSSDPVLAAGDVVYVTEEDTVGIGEVLERIGPLLTVVTTVSVAVILIYLAP